MKFKKIVEEQNDIKIVFYKNDFLNNPTNKKVKFRKTPRNAGPKPPLESKQQTSS
jgi:hypothetical protein